MEMAYHTVYSVVFTVNVYVFRTNSEVINNETRFVQRTISYIIHHFRSSNGFHQRYGGHYIVYRSSMRLYAYGICRSNPLRILVFPYSFSSHKGLTMIIIRVCFRSNYGKKPRVLSYVLSWSLFVMEFLSSINTISRINWNKRRDQIAFEPTVVAPKKLSVTVVDVVVSWPNSGLCW